ncbi:MAG: YHS domain-containing protein [Chloroflexi bacterium]|nr:YHS domain-containing protein [Chloroflexota bacterium]
MVPHSFRSGRGGTAGSTFSMDPRTGRRSARRFDPPTHPTKGGRHMADKVKDPVCGMMIRPEDAAATEEHEGRTFYFCSHGCHNRRAALTPRDGCRSILPPVPGR